MLPETDRKIRTITFVVSSSMSTAAHNVLRAAITVLGASYRPLVVFHVIESGASTGSLDEEMERLVRGCDAVIMVLHKPTEGQPPIRQGVAKEYVLAREHRKPLMLFTEAGYENDPNGKAFLSAARGDRAIKTYSFANAEDLLGSIEASIFSDMLGAYLAKLQRDGQRVGPTEPPYLSQSIAGSALPPPPGAVITVGDAHD